MTTAHYIMQVIAYSVLALSCIFWMFAKLTLTGVYGKVLVKLLVRGLPFIAAIWLVLEIIGVKY